MGAAAATVVCFVVLLGSTAREARWPLVASIALATFVVNASLQVARISEVRDDWENASAKMQERGLDRMMLALESSYIEAADRAERALNVPNEQQAAFGYMAQFGTESHDRSTILYRNGRPFAWSGAFRVNTDQLAANKGAVTFTDFFVVLHVEAARVNPPEQGGDHRAVAVSLLKALPPADGISSSLVEQVAERSQTSGFEILPGTAKELHTRPFVVGTDTLALVRALPLVQGQVELRLKERLTAASALLLAVAAVLFLCIAWRRLRGIGARGASFMAVLGALALTPLNQLSNRTRLFDPSIYFSNVAGPLTANAGTMMIASALCLLTLIALLRSQARVASRRIALGLVVGVAILGPFFLRDLARGIAPPVWGSSTALWLALQVALFMAASVVLLAGASAGRALLGAKRGIPTWLSVGLALLAAALSPLLLEGAGRYPGWYPTLWILSIGALALSRAARGFMLSTATVAALGAATLAWSASIRQRTILAERDLAAASSIDEQATMLLDRFGKSLYNSPAPRTRAELLRAYVNSDIASAQYPMELFVWDTLNVPVMRLSLSRITADPGLLTGAAQSAREQGIVLQRQVQFIPGAQMLIAVPHSDGHVTMALVAPRTRIVRDEPFLSLFGLTHGATIEPPYTINFTPIEPTGQPAITRLFWQRGDDALHGDLDLPKYNDGVRAHLQVDIRSYDVLIQRGTLVLLLDLLIFIAIWALAVAADGALGRWIRTRRHLWANSYRVRLTLALFGFFVVPAAVFAFWSHRGILAGDRQARELLVTEMLRAAENDAANGELENASDRLDAPLFLFDRGALWDTSDSLFLQLAPLGRRLPPRVFTELELGEQRSVSFTQQVGPTRALVGYRVLSGPLQRPIVLAAPARADHLAIDRRRRDLGVLLVFTTAVGALAALMLSGVAARQLARPIGVLRGAALAIARGEREPRLPVQPRSEFEAVFAAFRTMASDLNASRGQLLTAQRRTEAILRNVASGVVAFDGSGRVTLANPRSVQLLGLRLEPGSVLSGGRLSALEKHVRAFLDGDEDEREFDQELGGKQMHGWLTRLSSGDGGAVLTLDDVSEMARAQRVIAWGQMARQVAHEIKNPLTPIRLGVQHLRRAHTDRREDFDKILDSNVARILAEIDRLDEIARAFSRYGVAPSQRSDASQVDVGDVARDVVELERMGEGEVEWRYQESEGALMALASEDELREVLLNLLENARHAGARNVLMSVSRKSTTLAIAVSDDGHGIPADILPRVFEPHFSTRSSGSGLGLAISRKLIEGWGGEISIASTPGSGTQVTILLLAPLEL